MRDASQTSAYTIAVSTRAVTVFWTKPTHAEEEGDEVDDGEDSCDGAGLNSHCRSRSTMFNTSRTERSRTTSDPIDEVVGKLEASLLLAL
jgi:hypothetical protein